MLRQLIPVCLLLGLSQGTSQPIVHRIFVATPYNSSIIFEYANTVLPEGQPLRAGKAECLTSELLATGLFADAQISLKPIKKGSEVDVDIRPIWVDFKDKVVVREISLEGFDVINENKLRDQLGQRGLLENVELLRYPLPTIRNMVLDSIRKVSTGDSRTLNDVEERLSDLSFRIEPMARQAARLRIIVGKRALCE